MERIDVGLIGEAAKQIDMAAYVLTDSAVIEALREAAERGVTVRNFSRSGEARQDNDLVALRGASVCAGFDAKFDRAWARI